MYVKIPGTPAGVPAIEEAIFAGVPVNVTLLFSREQYLAVAEAYMRGLERRIAAKLDVRASSSVASLFVSRWDKAVADKVPAELRNRLGIAIAARTYKAHCDLLKTERWRALAAAGARMQRMLWASTGTKDPKASPTLYVEALAAPEHGRHHARENARSPSPKQGEHGGRDAHRGRRRCGAGHSRASPRPASTWTRSRKSFSWKARSPSSSPGKSSCRASRTRARRSPPRERAILSARLDPLAGQPAPADRLVDVPRLITAYYTLKPDPGIAAQRVAFGTSGHRGSSFAAGFNENHVLAITQAICAYRRQQGIDGPLFIGFDTHALSAPAFASALEVLAANGVEVLTAADDEYTPTPAVSHAILTYNRGRTAGLADGIVITPSHNPPDSGGFKYNPPDGGPADTEVTGWIEAQANGLLEAGLKGIARMDFAKARRAAHASRLSGNLRRRSRQRDRSGRDPRRRRAHGRRSARRRRRALLGAHRGRLTSSICAWSTMRSIRHFAS